MQVVSVSVSVSLWKLGGESEYVHQTIRKSELSQCQLNVMSNYLLYYSNYSFYSLQGCSHCNTSHLGLLAYTSTLPVGESWWARMIVDYFERLPLIAAITQYQSVFFTHIHFRLRCFRCLRELTKWTSGVCTLMQLEGRRICNHVRCGLFVTTGTSSKGDLAFWTKYYSV